MCVGAGLELNYAGLQPSRNWVWHPCFRSIYASFTEWSLSSTMYSKEISFYSILGSYFLVLPVIEVHDCLYGTASSSGDVPFKPRKQRCDHIHAVLFTIPVNHTERTWYYLLLLEQERLISKTVCVSMALHSLSIHGWLLFTNKEHLFVFRLCFIDLQVFH